MILMGMANLKLKKAIYPIVCYGDVCVVSAALSSVYQHCKT